MTSVLLVGEGDFSFTVSFLQVESNPQNVITSSLLSEDQVNSLHKNSGENIRKIRNAGGKVIFSTDATLLHENAEIGQYEKFDIIMFNFPHTGGKSNMKRNRQLLKTFFLSAEKVLAQGGQIRVALARGQGGTPADRPMREWQNSWQIVAMANYADLILHRTEDFNSSNFPDYSSSGFRSQDKHFHTENAVVHIFKRSYAESKLEQEATPPMRKSCVLNGTEYWFGNYITDKISRISEIFAQEPYHPFNIIKERLQEIARRTFGIDAQINLELPRCVLKTDPTVSNFRGVPVELPSCEDIEKNLYTTTSTSDCSAFLRTTLLENDLSQDNLKGSKLNINIGDVYKPCVINERECPIDVEAAILNPLGKFPNFGSMSVLLMEKLLCGFKPELIHRDNLILRVFSNYLDMEWFMTLPKELTTVSGDIDAKNDKSGVNTSNIVAVYGRSKSAPQTSTLIISFVTISNILYRILDPRILWTRDVRYYNQFAVSPSSLDARPYSIYPPRWTFDLSFWINESFDEQSLFNICRDHCGDCLSSVHVIDKFVEEKSNRVSLCYRLIFQSCDVALSYSKAHRLQNAVRIAVVNCLSVELR